MTNEKLKVWIVAMRGRNPENPTRVKGDTFEQRLEPNIQGIANTITTVSKDNLVLEKEMEVGRKIL